MNPLSHDGRTTSPHVERAESGGALDLTDTDTVDVAFVLPAPVSAAALHMPTGFLPARRPWLLRLIGGGR